MQQVTVLARAEHALELQVASEVGAVPDRCQMLLKVLQTQREKHQC